LLVRLFSLSVDTDLKIILFEPSK